MRNQLILKRSKQVQHDLNELEKDGYRHGRCDREIAEYTRKAEIARANGKLGGRRKAATALKNNPVGTRSVPMASQDPL